jgi:hypothetical protein
VDATRFPFLAASGLVAETVRPARIRGVVARRLRPQDDARADEEAPAADDDLLSRSRNERGARNGLGARLGRRARFGRTAGRPESEEEREREEAAGHGSQSTHATARPHVGSALA